MSLEIAGESKSILISIQLSKIKKGQLYKTDPFYIQPNPNLIMVRSQCPLRESRHCYQLGQLLQLLLR